MVDGAALEMLCPERDLGFESLTLRQKRRHTAVLRHDAFFLKAYRRQHFFLPHHRLSGSSSGSARAFSIVAALSCFDWESR